MSSSPGPMTVDSSAVSTAGPSTPADLPPDTMADALKSSDAPSTPPRTQAPPEAETPGTSQRYNRLQFLLKQSSVYSTIMHDVMHRKEAKEARKDERAEKREGRRGAEGKQGANTNSKKRTRKDYEEEEKALDAAEASNDAPPTTTDDTPEIHQPESITGAKLRDYQLQGLQWLASLHSNGLNGILADEMGLGKTLQVIALIAHLKEHDVWGPYLIVCPLSVMHNWVSEFEKFAPSIPVLMYHGNKAERAELQKLSLAPPHTGTTPPPPSKRAKSRKSKSAPAPVRPTQHFPVVVTTYEMIIRDRAFLGSFEWKHLIVDEGHRLKNMESRLIKEIKGYRSLNRLILTGTPLHNNLAELWSLLNFILPDIFDDLDAFQQWFNFDDLTTTSSSENSTAETLSREQTAHVVSSLHSILKPFLLRRLKTDVEVSLPPKKEYVLYAPLTRMQKELYRAVVGGGGREWLVGRRVEAEGGGVGVGGGGGAEEVGEEEGAGGRRLRKKRKVRYEDGESDAESDAEFAREEEKPVAIEDERTAEEQGVEYMLAKARKVVGRLNLQNRVMQLRKVSSHPYLFDWPADPRAPGQLVVDDQLVGASGKMLLLERLLDALFAGKHKVLIFSQFTTMLDIIEDWARLYKGWDLCRIDGSTAPLERRAEMERFNRGGEAQDAVRLFLLSTRAGGLGINLVEADTVIFYDQDWNPQMDLQAQDRAHRIGQTRPVLIFRLVSAHTIETRILQRAAEKRKLEALVIAKGKFKAPGSGTTTKGGGSGGSYAEIAAALLALEGENITVVSKGDEIISDADLGVLLDRRPEVFTEREKGWTAGAGAVQAAAASKAGGEKQAAAGVSFEVIETAADEGNERLAAMMGESFE